jgi:triosephosphate isomerase
MARRRLIAGNWKMNGFLASRSQVEALAEALAAHAPRAAVAICPPATLIAAFAQILKG